MIEDLRPITQSPAEISELQRVLEEAPKYSLRTTGALPGANEAGSMVTALPPKLSYDQKFVLGIYADGKLIGCIDILRGYPDKATAMLGLLLLSEKVQNQGYGKAAYTRLENLVRGWPEIQKLRIGVVESNSGVLGFWEKQGFIDTGARTSNAAFKSEIIILEKPIRFNDAFSEYFLDPQKPFVQPELSTERMVLEAITEAHTQELLDLFADNELHHFVPYEPISFEKQQERCARWSKRRSSDGTELWLNWAARETVTQKVMAHFQAGLKSDGTASIGYVVSKNFQRQGFAFEGLQAVFDHLESDLCVREVKAWSDTRNVASHKLAKKLGMAQVDFIKDADFFKGATSDEFVFSKMFGGRNSVELS